MNCTKTERSILSLSICFAAFLSLFTTTNAMHIMEGYLPLGYAIAWGAICIPFVVWGIISIKHLLAEHRRIILLLAMMGAYAFVLSALKLPSVTGSSSHPTGTGLGAILFGPGPMVIIGMIVLLFQSILLAHGGLTTLGANTFSMAIAGPIVSFILYKVLKKCKLNSALCVGIACAVGDLFTYCITSIQLGLAHPSEVGGVMASIVKFMGIFATTQIPLAIVEGILSAIVILMLESFAKPELREIGYLEEVR